MRKLVIVIAILMMLSVSAGTDVFVASYDVDRPSVDGALQVKDGRLCNEAGEEVLLRGVSMHGITYFQDYVDDTLFGNVSDTMNANLIRLPMYTPEYAGSKYCSDPMGVMKRGIDYAIANDMYVIVDWHTLENPDPNMDTYNALRFFKEISREYGDCPNIIYEICNEPNGATTWKDICRYADTVIPVIRKNSPDSVIIVGTPNYDREITAPAGGQLDKYGNIMYSFHFYAASHSLDKTELKAAVDMGIPVFISECGFTEDTGDGTIDVESTQEWLTYLQEQNLSHTIWNMSDKKETSSMLRPGTAADKTLGAGSLTVAGKMVRNWLVSNDPAAVTDGLTPWEWFRIKTGFKMLPVWLLFDAFAVVFVAVMGTGAALIKRRSRKYRSYGKLLKATGGYNEMAVGDENRGVARIVLVISILASIIYLIWRMQMSLPVSYGVIPLVCSVILLVVEIVGFFEFCIHNCGLLYMMDYKLPEIEPEDFPDVDIFVSTYNEPEDLLRKTLVGCRNMKYPDPAKVHIYLCDDNRRSSMRELAAELGVNYLDRDNHDHAKAGNLNHAMSVTSSPYIVTFDADMIPREEFLLKTIPYFVDAEKRNAALAEGDRMPLGFIQTPQCFYNPDVFQHNLRAEYKIPNEQDYFYRTIEKSKTESNSVIYGGSNTILSRAALTAIGGFYTDSITEDFATGALIESAGFISMGLSEPLASGVAPYTFPDHIKQRKRWGRGVINTMKKLGLMRSRKLTSSQKAQYLTSVLYWYSPIKNFVYILSPFLFALFGITVFVCDFKDLMIFWLPLFVMQAVNMRVTSKGTALYRYCTIQEVSIMPFLFFDVIKETFGVSMTKFVVTDKSKGAAVEDSKRYMLPFAVLIALSIVAMVRIVVLFIQNTAGYIGALQLAQGFTLASINDMPLGLVILMFWVVRNLIVLIRCMMLVRGRESDEENVKVKAAYMVTVEAAGSAGSAEFGGVTTLLTEHSAAVYLDEVGALRLGESVRLRVDLDGGEFELGGAVVNVHRSRRQDIPPVYTIEILDFGGKQDEYIYELYNRVPTLPQRYFPSRI